jgi:hypothetical protein
MIAQSERQALDKFIHNPMEFVSTFLDKKPRWSKQIEILESVRNNRNTYVKSCHGVGKTFTAKDVALWFLYCFYPSTVLTTAPSWPQVEKLLWAEINHSHANALMELGGACNKTELHLDANWFALGISPKIDTEDEGKRITGFHNENLLVIFDEAPSCNSKLWDIKETLMTSENVRFLAIGNPVANTGHFYEGFKSKYVNAISMNIFDSPNFKENNIKCLADLEIIAMMDIEQQEQYYGQLQSPYPTLTSPRWAVERLVAWGADSPLFKSRVIAEFPEQSLDTIISLSSLERCQRIETVGTHERILGVDIARFGSDDTVFYGYENYKPILRQKFNGQDLVKTSNMIKHHIHNGYKIIVLDDTGLGGGVTDILADYSTGKDFRVIPVNFAQASPDEEYDGIVTSMYYHAKKLIEDKDIQVIDDGELFQQLTDRKYKFTNKGKIKIESKDEYKKRTGRQSPDEADAFILCLWGIRNQHSHDDIEAFGEIQTGEL